MKPVILVLTTEAGNEIGRLPVASLKAGIAENSAAPDQQVQQPRIGHDVTAAYDLILRALQAEGFDVALDLLDFHLSVSRVLVSPVAGEEVIIPLPVRQSAGAAESAEVDHPAQPFPSNWDELFGDSDGQPGPETEGS